jgi:hypothetical protein
MESSSSGFFRDNGVHTSGGRNGKDGRRMSDPYEDFMHARAGLNEPAPEEPEDVMDAEKTGEPEAVHGRDQYPERFGIPEIGRYDNEPTVAEALRQREQLRKEIKSSQANSELLLGALIGNGDVRL